MLKSERREGRRNMRRKMRMSGKAIKRIQVEREAKDRLRRMAVATVGKRYGVELAREVSSGGR